MITKKLELTSNIANVITIRRLFYPCVLTLSVLVIPYGRGET